MKLIDAYRVSEELEKEALIRGITAGVRAFTRGIGGVLSDVGNLFRRRYNKTLSDYHAARAAETKAKLRQAEESLGIKQTAEEAAKKTSEQASKGSTTTGSDFFKDPLRAGLAAGAAGLGLGMFLNRRKEGPSGPTIYKL